MAVCVDRLRKSKISEHWFWHQSCHLYSDSGNIKELHNFAFLLGLNRSWLHDKPGLPHYDLTIKKRKRALLLGAKEKEVHNAQ